MSAGAGGTTGADGSPASPQVGTMKCKIAAFVACMVIGLAADLLAAALGAPDYVAGGVGGGVGGFCASVFLRLAERGNRG